MFDVGCPRVSRFVPNSQRDSLGETPDTTRPLACTRSTPACTHPPQPRTASSASYAKNCTLCGKVPPQRASLYCTMPPVGTLLVLTQEAAAVPLVKATRPVWQSAPVLPMVHSPIAQGRRSSPMIGGNRSGSPLSNLSRQRKPFYSQSPLLGAAIFSTRQFALIQIMW